MAGALDYSVYLDDKLFKSQLLQNERRVMDFSRKSVDELSGLENSFKRLGQIGAGYLAFDSLKNLGSQLITVRGEFQQLEIAFGTMLGSKAKADKLMGEVINLAATTPFGLKDAAGAIKQMLAYGFSAQTVIGDLRQLGDVAAGVGAPIGDLAYLFGTLKAQGRAMTVDIRQFAGRGIPIYEELAKVLKVNVDQVGALVEAGKVGFPEVQKAFAAMTSQGGMFFNLMEEQSKSLPGLTAQFSDAVDVMFNDLGRSQQGAIADTVRFATLAVQNYEPILKALEALVITYGAYRAAIIATAAVQALPGAVNSVNLFVDLAKSIRSAGDAHAFFNLVVKANPYIIAGTALVSLIATVALFSKTATEAENAQDSLNKALEGASRADDERKVKIEQLRKAVTNETLAQKDRKRALDELIALSPKHLGAITQANAATDYATQAIKDYNKAMEEKSRLDVRNDQFLTNQARAEAIRSGKLDKEFKPSAAETTALYSAAVGSQGNFDVDKEIALITAKNKEKALKDLTDANRKILEETGRGIDALRALRKQGAADAKLDADKSVKDYEDQIKDLKSSQDSATSRSAFDELQKRIDEIDAKRRQITGELTKEQAKYQKDADKVGPFGSLSYWENVAKKAQEVIDKTPASNSARLAAQTAIKAGAEKQVEDIRQKYAIKSFEEEINYKKQQFELYQRWVTSYGKDAADTQFKTLVSSNQNYLDYLNAEILKLQPFANSKPLAPAEVTKLGFLNTEKDRVTGNDNGIAKFNEQLAEATNKSLTLTQQLERLAEIQTKLGTPKTDQDFEKVNRVNDLRQSVKKELDGVLNDFVVQANANGAKIAAVESKYAELKREANKKSSGLNLKNELVSIEKAKQAELDAIADEEFEQSEAYKRINKEYIDYGRNQIRQKITDIRKALAEETMSIERRKQLEFELAQTQRELNKNTSESLRNAASILTEAFGDASLKLSANMEVSVKRLAGVINSVANLTDKSASKMSKVSSIVDIFSFLTVSVRDALMTQKDLLTGMEPQKQAYQDIASEIEGINILLERQKYLLDDLKGNAKTSGMLDLLDAATKDQEASLQALKDLQVDVIKSQKEVFIDPVWGTEVENKGLKALYANLVTLGQAKTKIKYSLEAVNTSGLDDIEDFIKFRAEIAKNGGMIDGKMVTEADLQSLDALIERYKTAEELRKDLEERLAVFFTGTTEDAIVDSMIDGFKQGKSSAADFADTFEDMMKNAITNSLKADFMSEGLGDFYTKFKGLAKDGFTSGEIAELKADYEKLLIENKKQYDAAQQITGITLGDTSGITARAQQGIAASMTEESASVIAGQFNALRITSSESALSLKNIDINGREAVLHLSKIAQNTNELYAVRRSLDNIECLLGNDFLRAIGGL
jgi:hypothetical protein